MNFLFLANRNNSTERQDGERKEDDEGMENDCIENERQSKRQITKRKEKIKKTEEAE